jgi:lipoprotein-anchoring transpeptidase ErfK/SrfK
MSERRLVVHAQTQSAEVLEDGRVIRRYAVSTGAKGLGCEAGSYKTPTGLLRVARKVGEGAAPGTVFRARQNTGQCWSPDPSNPLCKSEEDLVLTRILWLEGCESQNINTLERYIYLHGTNQEQLLGTPASHGCIRFSNQDIAEVFDLLSEGSLVEILAS